MSAEFSEQNSDNNGSESSGSAPSSSDNANESFTCNICFDTPTDPVLTQCGHMFCWSCINEV